MHVAVFNEGEEGFQEKQDLLEELKIKEDEKKKEDKKIKEAKKINEAKQMAEKKAEAEKYLIIFSQVSFDFWWLKIHYFVVHYSKHYPYGMFNRILSFLETKKFEVWWR